ncbi:MAG: hypothetical protein GX921_07990, partial [Bacteroidales bacterium]|nr:hypothetical protein [Bacteroidales bacterium]
MSGTINLKSNTKIYARVGGMGQVATDTEKTKGGFNCGGDAKIHTDPPSSGGGTSDIRIYSDDLWHRIIVAGGGGGCDDYNYGTAGAINDGGGAGGYPNGQGYWLNGKYTGNTTATQLYGFSFGQGES